MANPADEYAGTGGVSGSDDLGTSAGVGGNAGIVDPAAIAGAATGTADDGADYQRDASGAIKRNRDGSPRRKPGRKGGGGAARNAGGNGGATGATSGGGATKSDLKASVDALANMLALAHVAIAGVTDTPEMALETDEAQTLAKAVVPVLDQFDFVPDPRFVAAFGLVTACAKVYGPRVYLIRARRAAEEQEARENAARSVFNSSVGGLQ